MEILSNFKKNGYFTAELYHLLAKKKLVEASEEIIPSEYIKEMKMTTVERLKSLNNILIDNIVKTGQEQKDPILSFTPRLLVFQNYKPNEKVLAKMTLRNISKAPTYLNMVFKENSYFSVRTYSGQMLSRLAPGMGIILIITFLPLQMEDYVHRISFYTDTDRYVVPLIAMAPRPVFNFPDEVRLPNAPLKVEKSNFLIVRNIGMTSSGFSLETTCPFSVEPKSSYLDCDENIEIKITFKTMHLGNMYGVIHAVLETGENFKIKLIGSTYTVSIELEKQTVRFFETYNGMVRQQTFKITNKSDHVLTYIGMKNEYVYKDFEEKLKLANTFYDLKESESLKYAKLVRYDVLCSKEHERVYTRIFLDEVYALQTDESLFFHDTHFSISPIKGKLWPNKPTEMTITFTPKQIGDLETTVYLDIDGILDRVPLKMVGISLPPCIKLNLETLDMGSVYINKNYNYEIMAYNKGHINGVIEYKKTSMLFGSIITCTPKLYFLAPTENKSFTISFLNSNPGPFLEEINFVIQDTKVVLKMYLKGELIYPSILFSLRSLDFGAVSLGVPKTIGVEVINESNVSVGGIVKLADDGSEENSIKLTDYAVADIPKPKIPQRPREFSINPSKIVFEPESSIILKVTLTANLIRTHQTYLELEFDKCDKRPITLPVKYVAMVPQITPAPDVNIRACVLEFPYKYDICFTSNEFEGYFTVEEDKVSNFIVSANVNEGFIKPNSTICLPVAIMTNVLGAQEYFLRIRLFGLPESVEICHIMGCGMHPIIICNPTVLHWGHTKLLTISSKMITLCNDSPVLVKFKAILLNRDGRWQVEPPKGVIEPESAIELTVTIYLVDAETYSNKLVIHLENIKDILVPLTATGVGTSIVVGDLRDRVVLGYQFTGIQMNCKVIMENYGTRLHALEWSEHYKAPKNKQLTPAFFNLNPRVFKMAAGEKLELIITGTSSKADIVKEIWYLVGSVEGVNKKELLLECEITAEFIDPKIVVSPSVIEFQYDHGPYSQYYKLTDILFIRNVSKLPLDIEINIKAPFAFIQKQSTYKIQTQDEDLCGCICYEKSDLNVLNISQENNPLMSKILIDYLTLKPVEPLREDKLQFFEDINKIKQAFNLTHFIEERLEQQEAMRIQILFDTTKHTTLKSRIYSDPMRIKFKGHKNKDAVKLIGRINFPNILILPPKVDFHYVLNGSVESKLIKIQNITPLTVCYRFRWRKVAITPTLLDDSSTVVHMQNVTSEKETKVCDLSEILSSRDAVCSEKLSEQAKSTNSQLTNPKLKINQDIRIKLLKKIAFMLDDDINIEFKWLHKFPQTSPYFGDCLNDVALLIPHRGLLKPNEIQYINVMMKPKRNTVIRALLECEVLGGPSEYISVTAQSSDLMYNINTQKVNFKIRSFHEHASEKLHISNVAFLPFDCTAYLREPKRENELNATILEIEPLETLLQPEEDVDIKIVIKPGVLGYFHRKFTLEIGHLPYVPIEVVGWGVVPQVYLSLPRPNMAKISPEYGYLAIATLTIEYLDIINQMFRKTTSEHLNSPLIEKCFEDPIFQYGWHIYSRWDAYPSTMDIELAIERTLVRDHLKAHPEILNNYLATAKARPISGFHDAPYILDFGVVITGSGVQRTIDVINYGPIATKMHLSKCTPIPEWLGLKICGKLNPGEMGHLDFTFSPDEQNFPELEQNVNLSINLEVPYGIIIPLEITALCAVPHLKSSVSLIDFGSVRCGNKVICSIPLKNIGKPTCIWYATLKLKVSGQSPMTLLQSSGKYEPGEGGWLNISFKPVMELHYEGTLIFRFHMNPNRMTIPIKGQGVLPQVLIIGPNIHFPPTLPWAVTTEQFFGLTNPCLFPIELIIAHTDVKWKEEEEIYQLLDKYYKADEMLVPEIKPGVGLPREIIEFHNNFNENVQKMLEDETGVSKSHTFKAPMSGKKIKSSKSSKSSSRAQEAFPRKMRTEAEIIADTIQMMKDQDIDPLRESVQEFDYIFNEASESRNSKGVIVVFHGSPCEEVQCEEMAYSVGKKLKLPTLTVDLCFVEALCMSSCPAKTILMNVINEMYEYTRAEVDKSNMDPNEDNLEETDTENDDEFETILKKLELMATKTIGTPKSKSSDKKKKKVQSTTLLSNTVLEAIGSSTMFNMYLTEELLVDYFSQPKFSHGFVVSSLSSKILKSPPLVLTTLLKCKPAISNIHLVLCLSNFNKWAQAFEEAQKEVDVLEEMVFKEYSAEEINQIIETFDDMSHEEYENADADLKSIYIAHGLEERRRKLLNKARSPQENIKKDKEGKDRSVKSLLTVEKLESKKKIKKDEVKVKPTNEYVLMNAKYNEYKNIHDQLINIANNWMTEQCEVGAPLIGFTGQIIGVDKKKSKKKSDIQLQMSEETSTDRGFPLTIINCPCLKYKNALVNMFAYSDVVKEALKDEDEYDILQNSIITKIYTVLLPKTFPSINEEDSLEWRFLDEIPIKKCECNQINDLDLLDDSGHDNVLNILSKWHCTCGKKIYSSQTSTSEIPSMSFEKGDSNDSKLDLLYPLPLPKVNSMSTNKERIILQPGELVRCKYTFSPKIEGSFSVRRYVEVYGWPESRVVINASGICDLPRLDRRPKKMFEIFVRRTLQDKVYKSAYLDDVNVFEFGPIFVGNNRIYEEKSTINLRNTSLIVAELEIEFLDETDVFCFDHRTITLEPGCQGKLTISAAPSEIGEHSNVLVLCIKNNPEVVTINIACRGVVAQVEILPLTKIIDYGKLLLYRREDDRFIVKNDSILPILWKIRNANDFLNNFIISQTSGIVSSLDNQVVPVTYIACEVGVISQKGLTIDIYHSEGRGDPMYVDTLYLSAECYDVMVECVFESNAENNLNYGNVKVNSTVTREMYMLNRGKYNIYYKLKKVKSFPEPNLLKSFEVTPECGIIPAIMKMVTVEFECTPTTSLNLVNVPAYNCYLLDGSKDQVVVAKFPIYVTIASFYNTFTLFPLGELNFHIIPVGISVMREVILNNTSKCPFTYEIVLPQQYQIVPENSPATKTTNKLKNPPLKCGNFLIMNEDNLLSPDSSRTIRIQFLATAARTFEETINFVISDTCPAEASGVPLKLVGTGALPTLDFWNIETTFREHLIVKNISEYKIPASSPHCVFVEDTVTLYFNGVVINTRYVGAVDLYNSGLVPCALKMQLHYQSNCNENVFSLDKYETHIEPLMHKKLGIIFNPKALEMYKAVLVIKLKKLEGQEESFKMCVIGEGIIPRITLISPPMRHHGLALLRFPVTCLGSVSSKSISFKNTSPVNIVVVADIMLSDQDERPLFWFTPMIDTESTITTSNDEFKLSSKVTMIPNEVATLYVQYGPLQRGKTSCDINLMVVDNPYEHITILCEAEAFMEDIILIGLEMLSMDIDLEAYKLLSEGNSSVTSLSIKRKSKTPQMEKKKSKGIDVKRSKKISQTSMKRSDSTVYESGILKYLLDLGGCELCSIQKRSIIMVNNSEKVYKFAWIESELIIVKPSNGYISPGEEKDLEIIFFSAQPVNIVKEFLSCSLTAINDQSLTIDSKEISWDNRQTVTLFNRNRSISLNERNEMVVDEQNSATKEELDGTNNIVIIYSVKTEYSKYSCNLAEEIVLRDTFIYQTRYFEFKVKNIGNIPLKILWNFVIDDEFPSAMHKSDRQADSELEKNEDRKVEESAPLEKNSENDPSKATLFSGSGGRESVDTWFEVDLPFNIEPAKACLNPNESCIFKVTFSPLDAFLFKVRLKSTIDNLDPYDQNITCKIIALSLIPRVHLDLEESDYLTSGRRKATDTLPEHIMVLEFKVLGSGCYKKAFNVINPTSEAYEFIFEMIIGDISEFVPIHCNKLKGYVEGGTSTEVVFTFSPTGPGVYESQWKFIIAKYSLVIHLLVVGTVRESDVLFDPTMLIIRSSIVGFTTENTVILRNNEAESLNFEFKGNSLNDESGKTPVIIKPQHGILKPLSETPIKIIYTPIQDGPLSFKIFCSVKHLTKLLTLCVSALGFSIRPTVSYHLTGNEHILKSEAVTNIHLDQTASTYERTIPFVIRNDGSATFFFDWYYSSTPVRKYLNVSVEPSNGHVSPGNEVECILYFTLKQVPVQAFPVTLSIIDGPEYNIYLYAEIEKPSYHFSCMAYDFGKCIINAPDSTYKKYIAFENDDSVPITLDLNFANQPELFVSYNNDSSIKPKSRMKISIYFRPKEVKEYEYKLQFWVNSLCEETVTIKGEGIPLLLDLYEGCQKSFDLGPVKVGEKIIRQIEVINHSKVAVEASFIFKEAYTSVEDNNGSEATSICLTPNASRHDIDPGQARGKMLRSYKNNKIQEQIETDTKNALSSLKVIPSKCIIKPYRKVPLKIQFKPVGMIQNLNVQLNTRVFEFERPLVRLSGSATGMKLCFSQNSLQFGRVRRRGCKILKVMLDNKGDYGTRFWWQPMKTDEFSISPLQGNIAAHSSVTFTVTFRPLHNNPFIKVWASCNIENYTPLELALYATCIDTGTVQNKTINMECPVRELQTEHIVITNPTDDMWLVLSEVSGESFETLKEFNVEANSIIEIPIHFKPKSFGKHEGQVLFSPLGESALFINLIGIATHPNPNGNISLRVKAKDIHTEDLFVYNITEHPESYIVSTEVLKVVPDKFDGHYEIKHPEVIKVWGEAAATCRWKFVCYEECQLQLKVTFTNEVSLEYQFYNIDVTVTQSEVMCTLRFEARARETVQKELVISNPLSEDADYMVRCERLECPDILRINKNSVANLTLKYSPLVVGDTEEYLEVTNELVGTYLYRIVLKCLPAKIKELELKTSLGTCIPVRLRAQNKTDSRAEFETSVSHPSILIDKVYALDPYEKGKFLSWFEPTQLGRQICDVSLKSAIAGEFVYKITGIATEPKPQGPFEIKAGGFTTIKFKNVFEDDQVFKVYVDREDFYVKSSYETIKSKKEIKIFVYMNECPTGGWKQTPMGCLIIECHESSKPKVQWTHFLQGIP